MENGRVASRLDRPVDEDGDLLDQTPSAFIRAARLDGVLSLLATIVERPDGVVLTVASGSTRVQAGLRRGGT